MPRVKKVEAHFNSAITQKLADKIVADNLVGKISDDLAPATTRKYLKSILLPDGYPETDDGWRDDVLAFMRLALWKGTRRLADTGMVEMQAYNLPVSIGILTEKLQLLSGQPTSTHMSMHVTASHTDLLARKAPKIIDSKPE